jgi:hypothetical protein
MSDIATGTVQPQFASVEAKLGHACWGLQAHDRAKRG